MTRVAIIAALPGELQPLVRGWERERRNGVLVWSRRDSGGQWTAACAGVGVEAATRAFVEAEKEGPFDSVISAGWAGALRKELAAGRAYRVCGVIDARTGERSRTAHSSGGCWLVTVDQVASQTEKLRLAAAHGASLVDMEAAGIARLAATRGIPFLCIKGVSDGPDDRLPDFNGFILANGRFQTFRFVLFAVLRPWYWAALARMGYNSRKAAQRLGKELLHVFDERAALPGSDSGPVPHRPTPD